MRKIIAIGFIIAGVIVSCKKEEITPTKPIVAASTCNCYEVHETQEPYTTSNGLTKVAWKQKYVTTQQPDLCSKETGQWVYSGNAGQFRYKVYCTN